MYFIKTFVHINGPLRLNLFPLYSLFVNWLDYGTHRTWQSRVDSKSVQVSDGLDPRRKWEKARDSSPRCLCEPSYRLCPLRSYSNMRVMVTLKTGKYLCLRPCSRIKHWKFINLNTTHPNVNVTTGHETTSSVILCHTEYVSVFLVTPLFKKRGIITSPIPLTSLLTFQSPVFSNFPFIRSPILHSISLNSRLVSYFTSTVAFLTLIHFW